MKIATELSFLYKYWKSFVYFGNKQRLWGKGKPSPIKLDFFFCSSHDPRECDKILADMFWINFLFRPILGDPSVGCCGSMCKFFLNLASWAWVGVNERFLCIFKVLKPYQCQFWYSDGWVDGWFYSSGYSEFNLL